MKLSMWKAFAAAVVTSGILGAQAPAQAETQVNFTVAQYSSKTGPFFKKVAADFEKQNPGIHVKVTVIPWDTLLQQLTTDIAAGTAPDISIIGTRWLLDFSSQGVAEPLNSFLEPKFKSTFIGTFMDPSVIDGKIMGLPVAASARAMMVNTDLFKKAGAKLPTTWNGVYEAAQKISKLPGDFGFGLQGKSIETDAYYYYALWTFGGDILNKDGTSGLDSPQAIEAASFYKKMIDEHLTQPSPTDYTREDVFNLFKQGKVGMIFTFPMLIPQIKKEAPNLHYKVMPFPKKAREATYGVTDTLMMFKSSKVKKAAWKFIKFAYQDKYRSEFDRNEGFLPVIKNVASEDYYKTNPDIAAFAAGLPYAKFAPTIANWEQIADTTVRALQQIYLDQKSPKEALTAAAGQINKIRGKK